MAEKYVQLAFADFWWSSGNQLLVISVFYLFVFAL